MDRAHRKELQDAYRRRCPEAGVVALVCVPTGQVFLDKAKNVPAYFNGCLFKLDAGNHPNKSLQALWNEHGSAAFDQQAIKTIDYDDPAADLSDDLELLLLEALDDHPSAQLIWKR